MKKYITTEEAVNMALYEAETKNAKGLLVADYEDNARTDAGDLETAYTLASLYGQFAENDEETYAAIENAIFEKYPHLQ